MENKGNYSFEDNNTKIKVSTSGGQQSLLFEDIASIGYQRMSFTTNPHSNKGCFIWVAGFVVGMIAIVAFNSFVGMFLVYIIAGIVGVVFRLKSENVYFDRISIETKGGKIIPFDVPDGTAQKEVEIIENKKRDLTGI
tara:strand:- start:248 stop:661 length:414 start_codon:yes stop_codon:yes gene_type:complete